MMSQRELYFGSDYSNQNWEAIDVIVARAHAEQSREMARVLRNAARAVARGFAGFFKVFDRALEGMRLYEELSSMSDRQLADIGLQREDIGKFINEKAFGEKALQTRNGEVLELPLGQATARAEANKEHKLAA